MIRKYHNHTLQTTPWHREEEPLNHHETPGRQIKQSNQFLIAVRQEVKRIDNSAVVHALELAIKRNL